MTTLDKIKAEIQKVLDAEGDSENAKAQAIALNWVLELFDKYAEQEPCDDAVSRQAVLEKAINVPIAKIMKDGLLEYCKVIYRKVVFVDDIDKLPFVRPQEPKWIPVTTRPMTEEEKERYKEQLEYVDDAVIFNCPLPDDGQEVLITVYGETELDTFYNDAIDGCYFENRDIEDVTAWMPLPEPYKSQKSEKINCKSIKCENCQNHNYCDYEPQESEE